MSDFAVAITGIEAWQKALRQPMAPLINAELTTIAEEGRDIVSVYPPAPPRTKEHWYERGYGQRWRRKDGSVGGRKTSQTMGRRWVLVGRGPLRIDLRNSATYSGFAHDSENQSQRLKTIGWLTELDMKRRLNLSKVGDRLVRKLEAT